ncbi:cytochrome P450 [Mollisia scopiformis]|uniref:Cytochrome P450 n=1 Tax=Mollisia scopiformis TaxID=149040 RepID=A0A194XJA4_MOLSC|nr:cytochrome P450 [Mollisia scopiformis]KUJ20206.1 cytochrome P450 [Mollisia scopiformis]
MDDDFYSTDASDTPANLLSAWTYALPAPSSMLMTILLAFLAVILATRYLSERPSKLVDSGNGRTVGILPYWLPFIGHGFSLDLSPHGIFALNLGATTYNVSNLLAQKDSAVHFQSIAWIVVQKFFGVPKRSKAKYFKNWEEFNTYFIFLMKEPHLSNTLKATTKNLERNIPQMLTFVDTEVDLQPWERFGKATYISDSETEVNLMALMRDMLGHASVPAFFGRALLDKYPELLHDVYDFDKGTYFFLAGLPAWTPWPASARAHTARFRLWQALDDHQRALDATAEGKPVDPSWGDLDDVSELIMKRNKLFRGKLNILPCICTTDERFEVKERADLSILWALVVNANLVVYWQILNILAQPGLLDRIRAEISPYATVSKPFSIGTISEAPKLTISHDALSKDCPLLRSTYLECLRLFNQPWSVRQIATDVTITGDKKASNPVSFVMHEGEYVTLPHDLHMRDPKYFKDPMAFDPERFIVHNDDGSLSTNVGTIRPYGGGPSMCKGRVYAEKECLTLVAGVLAFWDLEPADKRAGWEIPEQVKTSAVSKPVHDTRVRIKRRKFDWEL